MDVADGQAAILSESILPTIPGRVWNQFIVPTFRPSTSPVNAPHPDAITVEGDGAPTPYDGTFVATGVIQNGFPQWAHKDNSFLILFFEEAWTFRDLAGLIPDMTQARGTNTTLFFSFYLFFCCC